MSIYRPDYKTLFIHVPKTAGTAMEQRPFLGGGGHWWALDYMQMYGVTSKSNTWQETFKWGFVRNPWDRFVSVYFRWPQTKHRPEYFKDFVMGEFRDTGFDIEAMKRNDWNLHHHFLPQFYFLCDDHLNLLVDFVGKYENLEKDWRYVCERIGVPYSELPVVNPGHHRDYREYYDDKTAAVIASFYSTDIWLFDYKFDDGVKR